MKAPGREPPSPAAPRFAQVASHLARIGRGFEARGWTLGTSGNLSAVVRRLPLLLAITASGVDKSVLTAAQVLAIDAEGRVARRPRSAGPGQRAAISQSRTAGAGPETIVPRPSSEALIHLAVVRCRAAGAVFHTHSVWGTLISDSCGPEGGVALEGYEMLKGLEGISTHEHREWLPVLANSQDHEVLGRSVTQALARHPAAHGILLHRHGLYTWGRDIAQAKRHTEILEFLLEVEGRRRRLGA